MLAMKINQRKHTLHVLFNAARMGSDIVIEAASHRELLEKIETYRPAAAA
jgi:hypothetical protein